MAAARLEGLIICGGCLTVNEQKDTLPLGSGTFCSQWLSDKAAHLQNLCLHLCHIPRHTQDEDAGLQAALCLLQCLHARHLWSALPWSEQQGFNAALHRMIDHSYKALFDVEQLTPLRWELSYLDNKWWDWNPSDDSAGCCGSARLLADCLQATGTTPLPQLTCNAPVRRMSSSL